MTVFTDVDTDAWLQGIIGASTGLDSAEATLTVRPHAYWEAFELIPMMLVRSRLSDSESLGGIRYRKIFDKRKGMTDFTSPRQPFQLKLRRLL